MSETKDEGLTAEEALAFTQNLRRRMAAHIMGIQMPGEGALPNDPDQQRILLTTIADMDRTTLTARKIETEARQGDADRAASMMIAKVMAHAHLKGNIYETDVNVENAVVVLPKHPEVLYEGEISPAELEHGLSSLSYRDFKQEFEEKASQ